MIPEREKERKKERILFYMIANNNSVSFNLPRPSRYLSNQFTCDNVIIIRILFI